jgi:hypothetical protein
MNATPNAPMPTEVIKVDTTGTTQEQQPVLAVNYDDPMGQAHDPIETERVRPLHELEGAANADRVMQQHNAVEESLEKRNSANEEGHAKNMAKIEQEAELAHENTRRHVPTGKEDNRNTPTIDKAGNKHW